MLAVGNFGKKLKRELKRNPKQAAVLALLAAVAVWFWLPLIWKNDESMSVALPETPVAATASAEPLVGSATSNVVSTPQGAASLRWQEIVARIEQDQNMKPIQVLTGDVAQLRNPFAVYRQPGLVQVEGRDQSTEEAAAPPADIVVTPEQAGLKVSGTIIGRGRSTAVINGQAFRAGDIIETKDGLEFMLASVDASGVVFERNGRQFALAVRRGERGGRIEMRRGE